MDELSALRARVAELEHALADRAAVEDELRARAGTYLGYLEQSGDSIFTLNSAGRYLYANSAFADGVGKPLAAIVGKTQWDVFPKDEADLRFAALSQVFASGKIRQLEVRVPRADGDRFYLTTLTPMKDPAGVVLYVLCTSKEITARKRAERLLSASEERLRQLLDHSPMAMALVELDGTIDYINRRAIETFGYRPEEIPDMDHWWRRAYPDAAYRAEVTATWNDLLAQAVATDRQIERNEYRVTCKDGRVIPTLIFGVLVGDQVFVMFDDITGPKKAEEDRLNLERRLLHAQKLESLGVLAGGVAHDFNNLLMAIIGNLDLALLGVPEGTEARGDIRQALAAARRAAGLANRMLAYSGRGAFAVESIDLNALVTENAGMLRVSTVKTATLTVSLAPDLPPVIADSAQLQQIVMNLITNASEALGDKAGSISLRTGVSDCDASYLAFSSIDEKPSPGRFVWLEVADTGCGMTPETLQRLFDPFFTTKFTGRGLGMSAVQGIVRGHHGAIMVDSVPDRGTTIRVLLPVRASSGEARARPEARIGAPAPATPLGGLALVVDDESAVRTVTAALLQRLGLGVLTAEDGVEALRVMGEHRADIRVALVDMTMPHMDGLTTFRELRRLGFDVPVILCSGFSEQENATRYAHEGLAGFIQKPYDLARLKAELMRVLTSAANPA